MPDSEYSEAHLNRMRGSYAEFALGIHPEWQRAYFQSDIIAPVLEKIALGDQEWKRTLLLQPFRYSKTSFAVETFIPYYLGLNPTHPVIQVSYGRELAKTSGTNIREIINSELYKEIFPDSALVKHSKGSTEFGNISGGRYYAGSFQTGVNGRGAKLLCIAEGQRVLTRHGWVAIEEVRVGDYALTPIGWRRVVNHMHNGRRQTVALSYGYAGKSLRLTPDHLVRTPVDGWAQACELDGRRIITCSENGYPGDEKAHIDDGSAGICDVYDIEVEGAHCFYAEGVLVHNCVSDPHKNLEELKDPTLGKVRKIYLSAVMRRCEPNAMVLMETARWAPYDLAGWRLDQDGGWDVIENAHYRDDANDAREPHPDPQWKVMRLRAEAEFDEGWRGASCPCGLKDYDGNLIPHGMPLWPGHWTCEDHLRVKREDMNVWNASYQLRPTLDGGYMFAQAPPQYYETIDATYMNTYIIVDPSVGKGRKSDRTAIGVIGTAEDGNYYLLDLVWDRLTPNERMDHIFRLHRKWRPRKVGYEEYGAQTDSSTLRDRMERENYRFIVTTLGRSGKWHTWAKPDRIRTLVAPASSGRIWLPDPKSPKTAADMADKIRRFVDKEWNKYPGSSFDDVLDMMARINDPDLGVVFPKPAAKGAPVSAALPGGTSWMAL